MGGGLMQLVAYGAQDIYLTGNPQITFFKVVYRRHTNFSMEAIQQTFNGTAALGSDVSATISRNGDLVHRLYLQHSSTYTSAVVGANENVSLVERYGESIIKECELEIGGQMIDKHTSMWNRVWSDLTEENPSGHFGASAPPTNNATTTGNGTLYQKMTGSGYGLNSDDSNGNNALNGEIGADSVNGLTYTVGGAGNGGGIAVSNIMMPLNFWFCRNPGLALPLIALQYHEVKVKMTFETIGNLVRESNDTAHFADSIIATTASVDVTNSDFTLFADYIYLDTDERRRFAQVSHEYLIEQLQYSDTIINQADVTIDLNFNHPVKELIWCMRNETATRAANGAQGRCRVPAATVGDCSAGPVSVDGFGGNFQLKLNGHDRFAERDARYFTRAQVWEHHSGYGSVPTMAINGADGGNENDPSTTKVHGVDAIAVYSFALKPEEHQPSGTCNFSRIDNAQLTGNALTVETTVVAQSNVGVAHESANVRLTIFAVNYNVLRIMSGMGGLAYSN
jgi:hypothetical protein